MRQKQMLSLLQSGYTTIECTYASGLGVDLGTLQNNKLYTFKTNLELTPGDQVVVPGPADQFKVVTVVNVHDEPEIDLDADFDYKWVAAKVDLTNYVKIITMEKDALKQLTQLEKAKKRKEAQELFKEMYGTETVPVLDFKKGETL